MGSNGKTAVVLFNLGGPGKPGDIEPFLRNFFSDRNIIALPAILRLPLARLIAGRRSRGASMKSYGHIGGKSPLLENTLAQALALEGTLGTGYRVFVCMRYWHPMADETARRVAEYAPDDIVLLPLYPQYSTTTTRSSFEDWDRAAKKAGLSTPSRRINEYPAEEGLVAAAADNIRASLAEASSAGNTHVRVLFSAHGLPEKTIAAGDPYQKQCEQSAAALAAAAGLSGGEWRICYQSRVGPLKWVGPAIGEELERAAADRVAVVVYPVSFVSEHVETLVELDIEYREVAHASGVPGYYRAKTPGTAPAFIAGLARLCRGETSVAV